MSDAFTLLVLAIVAAGGLFLLAWFLLIAAQNFARDRMDRHHSDEDDGER